MRVFVCVTRPAEWERLATDVTRAREYRFCATPLEVVALVRHEPPPAAIVWDVEPLRGRALLDAFQAIGHINPSIPQLFRVVLGLERAHFLAKAMRLTCPSNVVVSLLGHDSLTSDLQLLCDERRAGRAEAAILARLSVRLEEPGFAFAYNVATAAVLVGRRRTTVACLARALGLRVRQLRERIREYGMMEPRQLLRWAFVLHCLRQAGLSQQPLKVIASEIGYRRTESLTNRMARLCGVRFRAAAKRGGFDTFLEHFATAYCFSAGPGTVGLQCPCKQIGLGQATIDPIATLAADGTHYADEVGRMQSQSLKRDSVSAV